MSEGDPTLNSSAGDSAEAAWSFPFSREEWEQVPAAVKAYILTVQQRLEQLESRLNRNSNNSNQPPSADGPFQKPPDSQKKTHGKPGGRKGHTGHRHAFLAPGCRRIEGKRFPRSPRGSGCWAFRP